jgi:WD40 repeat protein
VHSIAALHGDQVTSVQCCDSTSSAAGGGSPLVLTAGRDNCLKVLDTRTYETIAALSHDYYRTASNHGRCCLTPDGRYAAAGSGDSLVYVWDVATERLAAQLESHSAAVMACSWSAGGRGAQLASCDKEGSLCIWG